MIIEIQHPACSSYVYFSPTVLCAATIDAIVSIPKIIIATMLLTFHVLGYHIQHHFFRERLTSDHCGNVAYNHNNSNSEKDAACHGLKEAIRIVIGIWFFWYFFQLPTAIFASAHPIMQTRIPNISHKMLVANLYATHFVISSCKYGCTFLLVQSITRPNLLQISFNTSII